MVGKILPINGKHCKMHDLAELKILIVEDEAESRSLLRGMLSEMGITQVYEAEDGKTGLGFMDGVSDIVDVILCDWNMPSMSGIDFLRKIRAKGIDIPFLMITGRGDHMSVVQAKAQGVSGYIRKPFTPVQVEARLRIVQERLKAA